MKKQPTATEALAEYFAACPAGRQRIEAKAIEKEFPKKGKHDATTPRERVVGWANHAKLICDPEGGDGNTATHYVFRKAPATL